MSDKTDAVQVDEVSEVFGENRSLEQYEKTGYLTEPFKMFHLRDYADKEYDFHYHDFYKIIYFVEGRVEYKIEGKTYQLRPHDFVLVDYNAIHKPEVDAKLPYERYVIYLSEEFVTRENNAGESLKKCFELAKQERNSVVHFAPGSYEKLLDVLQRIEAEEREGNAFLSDKLLEAAFLEFMVLFNRACIDQPKAYINTAAYNEKIVDVISYIQEHLTESVSIDMLAANFYMSKYYLMRQFKEATGYSIHQYINEKRILTAKRMIQTGIPASKACYECGFSDYSTFARRFKAIVGCAPSEAGSRA